MTKKGFFRSSQLASKKITQNSTLPECGKCKLSKKTKNKNIPVSGTGKIKILHIDQYPTTDHFINEHGKYYARALQNFGIDIDECLKISAISCSTNKKPTKTQIKACYPNLKKVIAEYNPHVIIPVGDVALDALISHKFQNGPGGIGTFRGFNIPDRAYKAWICPINHPSYVTSDKTSLAAKKIFMDDLEQAVKMLDVPLPKYTFEDEISKIEILKHPKQTISWLKSLLKRTGFEFMTAFDYETSGLKPQHEDQFIRTCAISHGPDYAAAFPMFDDSEFLNLFAEYLKNKRIKKIAANMKFENDWSNVKLGMKVNSWLFDTMLAQHLIDNRSGICSLEFQNYVYFGIEPYDTFIKKHLRPNGTTRGNKLNTIDEADLYELLIYNGMDSMTEFRLAIPQMELLGIDYLDYYDSITNPTAKELAPQLFIRR